MGTITLVIPEWIAWLVLVIMVLLLISSIFGLRAALLQLRTVELQRRSKNTQPNIPTKRQTDQTKDSKGIAKMDNKTDLKNNNETKAGPTWKDRSDLAGLFALTSSFSLGTAVGLHVIWAIPIIFLVTGILISLYIHYERKRDLEMTDLYVRLIKCQKQKGDGNS